MKTILTFLLSTFLLIVFATRSLAQTSGDEAAIRQVLDATQLAFDKRDAKEFISHFTQSPKVYFLAQTPEGMVFMARGYDNMAKMVGTRLKELADIPPSKHTISQYVVTINDNSAWVTFTQHEEEPGGDKSNISQLSILEKQGSVWKIVAQTWQIYTDGNLVEAK